MTDLAGETSKSVATGSTKLDHKEIVDLLQLLPSWSLTTDIGVERLEKVFRFKDFKHALDFTVSVGRLADEVDHHPSLLTEWGSTRVTWWTHSVQGLLRNDFILAAKTDDLYQESIKKAAP